MFKVIFRDVLGKCRKIIFIIQNFLIPNRQKVLLNLETSEYCVTYTQSMVILFLFETQKFYGNNQGNPQKNSCSGNRHRRRFYYGYSLTGGAPNFGALIIGQIFQLIGEVAKVLASKKIKKVPVVTAKGVLACVVWRFTIMRYIFKLFFSGIDK